MPHTLRHGFYRTIPVHPFQADTLYIRHDIRPKWSHDYFFTKKKCRLNLGKSGGYVLLVDAARCYSGIRGSAYLKEKTGPIAQSVRASDS